jgi:hypothetical protein
VDFENIPNPQPQFIPLTGDQIIAYQGSAASPTFIYAIHFEGANNTFAANATNEDTSALPTGLTLGTTAVAINYDNAAYSSVSTHADSFLFHGNGVTLLNSISDFTNWVGADRDGQNAREQKVQK